MENILSPSQIIALSQSNEGRRLLFTYIISARIGYAMQSIFEMLNVVPEAGIQHKACDIMYTTLFRVPVEDIFRWIDEVQEWHDNEYHEGVC